MSNTDFNQSISQLGNGLLLILFYRNLVKPKLHVADDADIFGWLDRCEWSLNKLYINYESQRYEILTMNEIHTGQKHQKYVF